MGSWTTTAPTNLKTSWTTYAVNTADGEYRIKPSPYTYLQFKCRVRASSAWLLDGRLCVRVENYSFATGDTGIDNPLTTYATVTDENGSVSQAPANTSILGDSTATAYGHLRGTYYYIYNISFTSPGKITAGIKAVLPTGDTISTSYWVDPSCSVTVNVSTRPSYSGGGGTVDGTWTTTAPTNVVSWSSDVNGPTVTRSKSEVYNYQFHSVCAIARLKDGSLCVRVKMYSKAGSGWSTSNPVLYCAQINATGAWTFSEQRQYTYTSGSVVGTWYYTLPSTFSGKTIVVSMGGCSPYETEDGSSYGVITTVPSQVTLAVPDPIANTVWINVNGTWKKGTSIWINVNGTWKKGTDASIKSGGVWK